MNLDQIKGKKWNQTKSNELIVPRLYRMSIVLIFLVLVGAMAIQPVANAQSGPSQEGQWSDIISWPHVAIHMNVLPTTDGKVKVMTWKSSNPEIWDPDTGEFIQATPPDYNLLCSGHSLLVDGSLFTAGGEDSSIGSGAGLPKASVYSLLSNSWDPTPNMRAGRWYPTTTTLSNGNVLVVAGDISPGVRNKLPQVFQISTWSWRNLTNAKLGLPTYPWMFLAPNGKVFMAGPGSTTRYLNTTGAGKWTKVAVTRFGSIRTDGSAVMYDDGKVLIIGGGNTPTATAEVIDLNAPSPAWRFVDSMSFPRFNPNATLLPDGRVLVTGGTSEAKETIQAIAVYDAEMWDPDTELFTTMARMKEPRRYHSTAVLLADGRVLAAGGDGYPTAEIYSPPYLFDQDGNLAARPTITSIITDPPTDPPSVNYGDTFFVETPEAAAIAQVTWIKLSSVTHAFNQNQRINRLSFSQAADGLGLNVTAPSDSNLCPPGHYMLFILNGEGVPSVAKIIQIE